MKSYNLPERMRSAKRTIHSIRTRGEAHVPPFHTTPDSRDRVVALRKAPLSRMFLLLLMILGFVLSLYNPAAADNCHGPVTGAIRDDIFNFTYESLMKTRDTDGVKKYRFERCVQNFDIRALFVDWQSTGLKGMCGANDIIYVYFDEHSNQNVDIDRSLWYGPAPELLSVSTKLRPGEVDAVRNNYGRVYLAQFDGTVELDTLFSDRESMRNVLHTLSSRGEEGFYLSSGGRIAVPTNSRAVDRLQERGMIQPGDFVSVNIHLSEQFLLIDNEPASKLFMSIYVDPQEINAMKEAEGWLPHLFMKSDNSLLNERLLSQEIIDLNEHLLSPQFEEYLEFSDAFPTVLKFPVQRISGPVKFMFGENDENHLIIPFGVASSN